MEKEALQKDLYSEIAKAADVEPGDVEKVLEQLGFKHAVNALERVSGASRLERISAKQLSVQIQVDKALLIK